MITLQTVIIIFHSRKGRRERSLLQIDNSLPAYMYKFMIRRRKEIQEELGKIHGFTNNCTSESTLDFIDKYCGLYQYFFKTVWRAELTETTASAKYRCEDSAVQEITQNIYAQCSPLIKALATNGGGKIEISPDAVRAYYMLFCATAASMTKKALGYMKLHREDLLNQYDIPIESSQEIYKTFLTYPAINSKNHQLAIHASDNTRLINYSDLEVGKYCKSKRNYPALGITALYLELPQLFYKSGLEYKDIKNCIRSIFQIGTQPSKIRIYSRPESFPKILSQMRSVKNKCVRTESSGFIWFEESNGIFGNVKYAYIGNIEDYVRFILDKVCTIKHPIYSNEDDGRCAPYLSNPKLIETTLPEATVNMAGIDIGIHTVFTLASYNSDTKVVTDTHIAEGAINYNMFKDEGVMKECIQAASDKLLSVLNEQKIKTVAIENNMLAKIRKSNAIRLPKFEHGGRISTQTRMSVSEEEAYYISLTGALISKLYKAGIKIYAVETFNTSKVCSNCGELTKPKNPMSRTFECPYCGNICDRDENAARNILNKLYAAEIKHKPIKAISFNKKYGSAVVYCVGNCYEEELIEKAAV